MGQSTVNSLRFGTGPVFRMGTETGVDTPRATCYFSRTYVR